jgi:predicted Rossmann-fold nucleotide-binding protein
LGDAYVIFRGGTGTISEFGMAWGLARLYFGHHKPLVLYGEFWNEVISSFQKNMRIRPEDTKVYKVANSPEDAYEAIQVFEQALLSQNNAHREEKPFQL